jgi:hypothetical protein
MDSDFLSFRRSEKQHDARTNKRGKRNASEELSNKRNCGGRRQNPVWKLSGWSESDKPWKILRKWPSGMRLNSVDLKMRVDWRGRGVSHQIHSMKW